MSTQYTGNRYVPKVHSITDAWSSNKVYEALEVVPFQGASYTSRKAVPIGIDILNTDYWVCTGNYDVQVEQYRQDTQNAINNVNVKLDGFSNAQDGKFQVMLDNYKTQINAYANGKYNDINTQIAQTNTNLENAKASINANMTAFETSIQNTTDQYTTTVNNQITRVQTLLTSIDLVYDAGTTTDVPDSNVTVIEGGTW